MFSPVYDCNFILVFLSGIWFKSLSYLSSPNKLMAAPVSINIFTGLSPTVMSTVRPFLRLCISVLFMINSPNGNCIFSNILTQLEHSTLNKHPTLKMLLHLTPVQPIACYLGSKLWLAKCPTYWSQPSSKHSDRNQTGSQTVSLRC